MTCDIMCRDKVTWDWIDEYKEYTDYIEFISNDGGLIKCYKANIICIIKY